MINSIDTITKIKFPRHVADNGDLVVMEGVTHCPFSISRVFVVRGQKDNIRGQHAHKNCKQLLVCSSGCIEIIANDGEKVKNILLDQPNVGLLVPPGIWLEQKYKENGTILTVLCDLPYDSQDYIRDYKAFLDYINITLRSDVYMSEKK